MKELVDDIHAHWWAFCQKVELDVDPVMLRRAIQQHVNAALQVVTLESLQRIGYARLAVMIDMASRYDLTLAELLNEALQQGADSTATLCREVKGRQERTRRIRRRPTLTRIK